MNKASETWRKTTLVIYGRDSCFHSNMNGTSSGLHSPAVRDQMSLAANASASIQTMGLIESPVEK